MFQERSNIMAKILQFVFIAGFFGSSAYGFLTMDDFRELIEPKCYDTKDNKELINGQVSPIPNSLETFIGIVERLEEKYNSERILRNLIGRFRYDDLLLQYVGSSSDDYEFVTRGEAPVKLIHELLQDILGTTMNYDLRSDLSEDEECALYFMISHTVNDSVTPFMKVEDLGGSTTVNQRNVLSHPREQGVVNLNGKTHHAFSLGKVLLGIFAGLQGSERTVSAEDVYKTRKSSPKGIPEYLKGLQINALHAVTLSDIIAATVLDIRKNGENGGGIPYLPNGYWDDSVCPTQYILTDNNGYYATRSLIRGAIDGLLIGKKIKEIRETNQEIRLSQILRMYYNPRVSSSDSSMSDVTWCNRHSFFTSNQNEIVDNATNYYQLYASLQDLKANDPDAIRKQMSAVISSVSSDTMAMFDDMSSESGECGGNSGSKICETPRDVSAVVDMKGDKDAQTQIIGNLSVGFHMSPSGSSMAVYTNLRSTEGTKLHSINQTGISGCASCAAKYFGHYENIPFNTISEVEVFRSLNRTLARDDFPDESEDEPGVPSKVVLYFNYGNPQNTHDLQKAVNDFRIQHSSTKIFAIGSKKENLNIFVERPDYDIYSQDVSSAVKSLQERVCKVPAEFQYKNCYKNSRADEDSHVFRGFVTPNHIQYWAIYPKYFLKSFNIKMTFTTASGQIRVCYTRNYDEMYGTRQSNMRCLPADSGKEAVFTESNPCKKRNVYNCRPFYFSVEGVNIPADKCTDKMCKTPNQIEFEFKHTGISCNGAISFGVTPMTLAVAIFMSIYFLFKH